MSNIKEIFKALGNVFLAAGKFIARHVSDAQIDVAISIVREASNRYLDNAERREYAVREVKARAGVPESIARWLVETAVIAAKAKIAEELHKTSEKLKELNDNSTSSQEIQ